MVQAQILRVALAASPASARIADLESAHWFETILGGRVMPQSGSDRMRESRRPTQGLQPTRRICGVRVMQTP